MRLIHKNITAKDGNGTLKLLPETPEDMWHCYNIISKGDQLQTTTTRKVVQETSTGSRSSSKVRMVLRVEIEKIEFDDQACVMRIGGKNKKKCDHVSLNSYHTLELLQNRDFTISKDCWDTIYLERIDTACNPSKNAETAAITMHMGLCHICMITEYMTITRQRIEVNIPRKKSGYSSNGKAVTKFFESIYQAILRHIDFSKIKCILLASPGFVKDDFFSYLKSESVRRDHRTLIESSNRSKFVLCRSSSGHKHALDEIIGSKEIAARMMDTKVAKDVDVLNSFFRMLNADPDKAFFSYRHVCKANELGAIDKLLLTDELFRSSDIAERKKYVQLVESCREAGGSVHVFSLKHVSGNQLQQVSGVAAILRFPLHEGDIDIGDTSSSDSDWSDSSDSGSEEEDEETKALKQKEQLEKEQRILKEYCEQNLAEAPRTTAEGQEEEDLLF